MNDVIIKGLNTAFVIGSGGGFALTILIELTFIAIKKAWYLFKYILSK